METRFCWLSFRFAERRTRPGDKLDFMDDNKRSTVRSDRRAKSRSGRREDDSPQPWYMRRRLWLAAASMAYVGWRRIRRIVRPSTRTDRNVAA
jgi:hypothetical protein